MYYRFVQIVWYNRYQSNQVYGFLSIYRLINRYRFLLIEGPCTLSAKLNFLEPSWMHKTKAFRTSSLQNIYKSTEFCFLFASRWREVCLALASNGMLWRYGQMGVTAVQGKKKNNGRAGVYGPAWIKLINKLLGSTQGFFFDLSLWKGPKSWEKVIRFYPQAAQTLYGSSLGLKKKNNKFAIKMT